MRALDATDPLVTRYQRRTRWVILASLVSVTAVGILVCMKQIQAGAIIGLATIPCVAYLRDKGRYLKYLYRLRRNIREQSVQYRVTGEEEVVSTLMALQRLASRRGREYALDAETLMHHIACKYLTGEPPDEDVRRLRALAGKQD